MAIYNKNDLLAQRAVKIYENYNFEITADNVGQFLDDFINSVWDYVDTEIDTLDVDDITKLKRNTYTVTDATYNTEVNLTNSAPDANFINIYNTVNTGTLNYDFFTGINIPNGTFDHTFFVVNNSTNGHIARLINSTNMDLSYTDELLLAEGDWAFMKGNVYSKTVLIADSQTISNITVLSTNDYKVNRAYYNWNNLETTLDLTENSDAYNKNYIELNNNEPTTTWDVKTGIGTYTANHKFTLFIPESSTSVTGTLINSSNQYVGPNDITLEAGDYAVMQGDINGKTRLLYTNRILENQDVINNNLTNLQSQVDNLEASDIDSILTPLASTVVDVSEYPIGFYTAGVASDTSYPNTNGILVSMKNSYTRLLQLYGRYNGNGDLWFRNLYTDGGSAGADDSWFKLATENWSTTNFGSLTLQDITSNGSITTTGMQIGGDVGIGVAPVYGKLDVNGDIYMNSNKVATEYFVNNQGFLSSTLSFQDVTDIGNTTTNDIGVGSLSPISPISIKSANNSISYKNGLTITKYNDDSVIRGALTVSNTDISRLLLYNSSTSLGVLIQSEGDSYLNGGNVGIGTSPATGRKLDVDGDIYMNNNKVAIDSDLPTVYDQTTEPSSGSEGDIWVDSSI